MTPTTCADYGLNGRISGHRMSISISGSLCCSSSSGNIGATRYSAIRLFIGVRVKRVLRCRFLYLHPLLSIRPRQKHAGYPLWRGATSGSSCHFAIII